jgi:hypothetical protein
LQASWRFDFCAISVSRLHTPRSAHDRYYTLSIISYPVCLCFFKIRTSPS